ncbi:MAG: peptidoglycan DD-metalloendopeptidase family protein [Fibrobacter sp.]|nr:peptidoglycan DD-metalloendopeptidase family protein [Fibrobacter sp.]
MKFFGICISSLLLLSPGFASGEPSTAEGQNVEVVDLNEMQSTPPTVEKEEPAETRTEEPTELVQKQEPEKDTSFFDFSNLLIPVTHEAKLGSPYGIRDHRLHRGVDVQVILNEPIVAAYPGKVIMSKYNEGGYGHYVLVEHEGGLLTLYGHLSKRSVKVGDVVFPGDIVGLGGNTGRSSGAHLHFEIRYGKVNIDPVTVIDFPNWKIAEGADHLDKKKVIQAHRKMQARLQKDNFYIVKSGDTLEGIAKWFNISVKALCRINNISSDKPLRIGQKLKGSQQW